MGSPVAAIGYAAKAAFVLCDPDNWDTPRAVGAGNGLEYGNESLAADVTLIPQTGITGSPLPGFGSKGTEKVEGALSDIVLQYEAGPVLTMLACAMGTAGTPTVVTTAKSWKHTLALAPDNKGLFGTLVVDKQVAIHEFGNFKPMGFTIGAKSNEDVKLSIHGIARKLDVASAVNTAITFADVTYPSVRKLATFGHARLFINEFSGAALDIDGASVDAIPVGEFSLAMERPLEPDFPTEYYPYAREPVSNGFIAPTGSLNFPVYATENAAMFQGQLDKTLYKAILLLESPDVIGSSTDKYKIALYIPALQIASGSPSIGSAAKVPLNLTWRAAHAPSTPSGFPSADVAIEITNGISADLLAVPA